MIATMIATTIRMTMMMTDYAILATCVSFHLNWPTIDCVIRHHIFVARILVMLYGQRAHLQCHFRSKR